jgi:hypothetical protein
MDDLLAFSLDGLIPSLVELPGTPSQTLSQESPWDTTHHDQACPLRSVVSVKFAETDNLACVPPRPLDGFASLTPVPDDNLHTDAEG